LVSNFNSYFQSVVDLSFFVLWINLYVRNVIDIYQIFINVTFIRMRFNAMYWNKLVIWLFLLFLSVFAHMYGCLARCRQRSRSAIILKESIFVFVTRQLKPNTVQSGQELKIKLEKISWQFRSFDILKSNIVEYCDTIIRWWSSKILF